MFARKVAARLKADSLAAFASLMECEVLPWLRKLEGFLDLITLVDPDGREVITITFWDHKRDVQPCSSSGYPEALKTLGELLEGHPYVKAFDVVLANGRWRAAATDEFSHETGSAQVGYRACGAGV